MQNKLIVLIVGLIVVAAVGFFGYSQLVDNQSSVTDGVMLDRSEDGEMMEDGKTGSEESMGAGVMIAGSNSTLYEFDQAMYENALSSGDVVFLYFYADWCPICRVENPQIEAGFDELTRSDVVGFRVNFKDGDTSEDESALASKLGVPYQHTKVIMKDGQEVHRSGEQWDKEKFLSIVGGI